MFFSTVLSSSSSPAHSNVLAGTVLGATFGAVVLAIAFVCFLRKRMRRKKAERERAAERELAAQRERVEERERPAERERAKQVRRQQMLRLQEHVEQVRQLRVCAEQRRADQGRAESESETLETRRREMRWRNTREMMRNETRRRNTRRKETSRNRRESTEHHGREYEEGRYGIDICICCLPNIEISARQIYKQPKTTQGDGGGGGDGGVCVVVRMEVAMEVATEGVEVRMGGRFNLSIPCFFPVWP
jgi:hypothetical protein